MCEGEWMQIETYLTLEIQNSLMAMAERKHLITFSIRSEYIKHSIEYW